MGCDFAIFAYCNKQGNCTDSFQKQKTWCVIVRYDAHHVFYINNSLCGVAKNRRLLLFSFPFFDFIIDQLNIVVGTGLILFDLEKPQRIDEGSEFGKTEISHVEIGESLGQLIA